MSSIPCGTTDWSTVAPTDQKAESSVAYRRTREFGNVRVRMVEYD